MSNSISAPKTAASPARKPGTPWWKHWYVLLAAVAVIIAVIVAVVPGVRGSGTPSPSVVSTLPQTQAWEGLIAQYENDFGIKPSSDWNGVITDRAVKEGKQLWIYTQLPQEPASKKTAEAICSKYSNFSLIAPNVTTVYVSGLNGETVTQCSKK